MAVENGARGTRVEIRDNGPGVLPDDRDKIFKRMFRSASTDHIPGNGLGLSMAATIAEMHGLSIRLCETSVGACFEIVLDNSTKTRHRENNSFAYERSVQKAT